MREKFEKKIKLPLSSLNVPFLNKNENNSIQFSICFSVYLNDSYTGDYRNIIHHGAPNHYDKRTPEQILRNSFRKLVRGNRTISPYATLTF